MSTDKRAAALFAAEVGGHRFQRVPPNEKRGCRQSSTVTVSVTTGEASRRVVLREEELDEKFCRGSGAGGQNRNKRDTCCVLTHRPTGITIREESERTQDNNRRKARERLLVALEAAAGASAAAGHSAVLRGQRGSGERSDKVRTYQLVHDRAVDHRNGRECRWADFARGHIRLLA